MDQQQEIEVRVSRVLRVLWDCSYLLRSGLRAQLPRILVTLVKHSNNPNKAREELLKHYKADRIIELIIAAFYGKQSDGTAKEIHSALSSI